MKKYSVTYALHGQVTVEAEDKNEAYLLVRGLHPTKIGLTDQELIKGILNFDNFSGKYSIDADAIEVSQAILIS